MQFGVNFSEKSQIIAFLLLKGLLGTRSTLFLVSLLLAFEAVFLPRRRVWALLFFRWVREKALDSISFLES